MARENKRVVLAERPETDIIPGRTFKLVKEPAPTADQLKDGEILVETLYLSLDPAMRGWLNGMWLSFPLYQKRSPSVYRCLQSPVMNYWLILMSLSTNGHDIGFHNILIFFFKFFFFLTTLRSTDNVQIPGHTYHLLRLARQCVVAPSRVYLLAKAPR